MIRRPPRSTRLTHSFPTRRSSDLLDVDAAALCWKRLPKASRETLWIAPRRHRHLGAPTCQGRCGFESDRARCRSEEHTSELQSLMRISYAVFCLQKKRKTDINSTPHTIHTQQRYTIHKSTT